MEKDKSIQNSSEHSSTHSSKTIIAFSFGAMADQMSHQAFQLLVFVFYYSVIGVSASALAWGFIIFAIWDSINDPLIGPISDRTKSRFGRRGFWVLISIIPFGLINLFIFTPPGNSDMINTIYMIVIIMLYDLFYTIFSSQQTSLFPEMFKNQKERGRANKIKNLLTILGLLLGFVLPTILISPMAPTAEVTAEEIAPMYVTTGGLLAVLVIILGFLFFKFGIKEESSELTKPEEMPSLLESLKMTLKNKTFIIFIVTNLFIWVVFKMLTTILPLYGQHVLEIEAGSFMLTLLLLGSLLTAAVMFPFLEKLGKKIGMRNSLMITETIWIVALIPFAFFDGIGHQFIALICMCCMGVGLAGAMYFVDIIIGSIIDEDELKYGKRRQGSFYGINALVNRYSTIVVFVSISVVLSGYGWGDYLVDANLTEIENLKIGLKVLMVGLNISVLCIILILLRIFPLHGKKLDKVYEEIKTKRENESR